MEPIQGPYAAKFDSSHIENLVEKLKGALEKERFEDWRLTPR